MQFQYIVVMDIVLADALNCHPNNKTIEIPLVQGIGMKYFVVDILEDNLFESLLRRHPAANEDAHLPSSHYLMRSYGTRDT